MKNDPTLIGCRACGANNGKHTSVDNVPRVPHDGDVSFCLYCGAWSIFEGGEMRAPTSIEAIAIRANPLCMRMERIRGEVVVMGVQR